MGWGNSGAEYAGWDMARASDNPFYNPYMSHVNWGGGTAAIYGLMKQQRDEEFQKQQILGQQAFERQKWAKQEERADKLFPLQKQQLEAQINLAQRKEEAEDYSPEMLSGMVDDLAKNYPGYAGAYGQSFKGNLSKLTGPENRLARVNIHSNLEKYGDQLGVAKATADMTTARETARQRLTSMHTSLKDLLSTIKEPIAQYIKSQKTIVDNNKPPWGDAAAANEAQKNINKANMYNMLLGPKLSRAVQAERQGGTLSEQEMRDAYMIYDKAVKDLGLVPEEGEAAATQRAGQNPPQFMTAGGDNATTLQTAAPLAPAQSAPTSATPTAKVAPKKKIPIEVLDALRKKYKNVPDEEFQRQWELTQK